MEYYKNHISDKALVFNFMYKSYIAVISLLITIVVLWYLLLLSFWGLFVSVWIPISILLLLFIFFAAGYLAVYYHNYKVSMIIYTLYNIDSKPERWKVADFKVMKSTLLKNYLKSKGIYHKESIKMLIEIMTKEIERRSPPKILAPAVFVMFFTPAWLQYIAQLFSVMKPQGMGILTILLLSCAIGAAFIAICVGGFQMMLFMIKTLGIYETLNDIGDLRVLLLQIEDIYLRLDHSE